MILTTWGYKMTDLASLDDMLSIDEFNTFSGSKYRLAEDRISAEISAACAAIRNYVGWHLFPSAQCVMETTFYDRRVTVNGPDVLVQLPARFVTDVESVTIDGTEYTTFVIEPNGILHIYDVARHDIRRYTGITVTYRAGLSEEMMAPVKELIAHRVTHSVAIPSGITQESSGGVSVTYNANWINSSRATALPDDNKEVLAPYRVQGVF